MNILKKFFTLFLLMNIFLSSSFAAQMVDDSIDSSIKAKYNTKKIEDDLLPDLPKTLPDIYDDNIFTPSSTPSPIAPQKPVQTQQPTVQNRPAQTPVNTSTNSYYKNNVRSSFIINSGKKFKVKLQNTVSDKTPEGTNITFVSTYPETCRYITIPAGTVFKGKVRDSHPPYLSGNGGLIVISVDEMIYKGAAYEIDATVSIANGKHIFFNNIKGKRKYMKNMWNSTTFGSNFLKKMWRSTGHHLNRGGLDILVAPFTLAGGVIVYGANVFASPFLALFTKGSSISIPSGSKFEIKLREDAVILK